MVDATIRHTIINKYYQNILDKFNSLLNPIISAL